MAVRGPADAPREFGRAVQAVLVATHPGDLVTYAELAAEAGFPGAARAVGRALHQEAGPWWRVVTADGRLAPGRELEQARRLAREGVRCVGGYVQR